jgi:hypothetical protein
MFWHVQFHLQGYILMIQHRNYLKAVILDSFYVVYTPEDDIVDFEIFRDSNIKLKLHQELVL